MALLIEEDRIVPAWCRAVERLLSTQGKSLRNIVLEITKPGDLSPDDCAVLRRIDSALRANAKGLTIETVASTIFPNGLYKRFGRPAFYDEAVARISRGRKPNTWGTYALRMMQRQALDGTTFNPLEHIVAKIGAMKARGRMWHDVLEVGVHDPADPTGTGCELPLYDPAKDRARYTNSQCLSHLSFKVVEGDQLDLTAMYRSHYYAQRALGNLVGLSQLLNFVARESAMTTGVLTCLSTHATLDCGLGSLADVRGLITPQSIAT